jgi:cytosine/adenosine deaminase-related metal-dependent hydrolase
MIFGRPSSLNFDRTEVKRLLDAADGIGLSSIAEWRRADLLEMSAMAKKARKAFTIHASERVREPFGRVAELEPAFVVHMVKASAGDIRACAERGTPVVVCPRSNAFFGLKPPVREMLDTGIDVALGTDNAMLARPDMLAEARYLARTHKGLRPCDILRIAISAPRKVLNLEPGFRIKKGCAAEFASLPCGRGGPEKAFLAPGKPTVVRSSGRG